MTSHRLVVSPYVAVLLSVVALAPRGRGARSQPFDLVLAGGRVLDPETGLDATRNVGIRAGRIAAVTVEPLEARETLDVHGLVVAPGFIDLHAHGQDSESYRYYAHDGVTTALELEIGTYPVTPWYAAREGRSLINYGVSVGHVGARRALITHDESLAGAAAIGDKNRSWTHGALHDAELPRLDSLVERGLAQGALGVGFGIAYTPGASREEILELFRVAARHGVPCFARLRRQGAVVVIFLIPDSTVRQTLADSLVMVASDGLSPHGHPRLAGTHARVLGRYARDSGALSLEDAVRKMTLLPAQRLERAVPAMRAKGRIQVGADADITVFDPARVVDEATYERPAQFSRGIVHVLVNGLFVVRNGVSAAGSQFPGRAIRRGS